MEGDIYELYGWQLEFDSDLSEWDVCSNDDLPFELLRTEESMKTSNTHTLADGVSCALCLVLCGSSFRFPFGADVDVSTVTEPNRPCGVCLDRRVDIEI